MRGRVGTAGTSALRQLINSALSRGSARAPPAAAARRVSRRLRRMTHGGT